MEEILAADERFAKQIAFILEIDRAKRVLRQTVLLDRSRRENDAEHSWHLALMAMLLHEYAAEPVDLDRTIRMLLVHDLVEIDAGDTFTYDEAAQKGKREREQAAADRIFGLLPADQGVELRALWEEFERGETAEARFASALDRLQPLLHNHQTEGATWQAHDVPAEAVYARAERIAVGAPELGEFARRLVADAVERGILRLQAAPGRLRAELDATAAPSRRSGDGEA